MSCALGAHRDDSKRELAAMEVYLTNNEIDGEEELEINGMCLSDGGVANPTHNSKAIAQNNKKGRSVA
jgi:hypothetical protein